MCTVHWCTVHITIYRVTKTSFLPYLAGCIAVSRREHDQFRRVEQSLVRFRPFLLSRHGGTASWPVIRSIRPCTCVIIDESIRETRKNQRYTPNVNGRECLNRLRSNGLARKGPLIVQIFLLELADACFNHEPNISRYQQIQYLNSTRFVHLNMHKSFQSHPFGCFPFFLGAGESSFVSDSCLFLPDI